MSDGATLLSSYFEDWTSVIIVSIFILIFIGIVVYHNGIEFLDDIANIDIDWANNLLLCEVYSENE